MPLTWIPEVAWTASSLLNPLLQSSSRFFLLTQTWLGAMSSSTCCSFHLSKSSCTFFSSEWVMGGAYSSYIHPLPELQFHFSAFGEAKSTKSTYASCNEEATAGPGMNILRLYGASSSLLWSHCCVQWGGVHVWWRTTASHILDVGAKAYSW